MKLRGLFPTTSALSVLLLGLLCHLPATHAVDCTNLKNSDSAVDIHAACAKEQKLAGGEDVNLALGTLDQVQLDELLTPKDHLNVGINIRDSDVESFTSHAIQIDLKKSSFIRIWHNLKLKKISLSGLQKMMYKATPVSTFVIMNNPKLTSIDIPANSIVVPIVAKNNGRLDQAGVDMLKAASMTGDLDVADPGVCDFDDLEDAAFLDGCHTNEGNLSFSKDAIQSATWNDVKLHVKGCLEVKDTRLTNLDFLKDAPEGCPTDPVITGNKQLCSFGPLDLAKIDTVSNCDSQCFLGIQPSTNATVQCTNILRSDSLAQIVSDCSHECQLSSASTVNLKLGGLNQAQLDGFIRKKDRIELGLDISDSAVERIESLATRMVLNDGCHFRIRDNLKLRAIELPKLASISTGTGSGQGLAIENNPKLTSISIPAQAVAVDVTLANNGRLDQAGLDILKGAAKDGKYLKRVQKPGECEFDGDLRDAAFLDGCHLNTGSLRFGAGAKQSTTWTDVKLHIKGCLEVKNSDLKSLAFLKDAPEGCPVADAVISGNKLLCHFGPFQDAVDKVSNCEATCYEAKDIPTKSCSRLAKKMTADFYRDKRLKREHIERIREVTAVFSIRGYPHEDLTINVRRVKVDLKARVESSGRSWHGLVIEDVRKLKRIHFSHKIDYSPQPRGNVWRLHLSAQKLDYGKEWEVKEKISRQTGVPTDEIYFLGRVNQPPRQPPSKKSQAGRHPRYRTDL